MVCGLFIKRRATFISQTRTPHQIVVALIAAAGFLITLANHAQVWAGQEPFIQPLFIFAGSIIVVAVALPGRASGDPQDSAAFDRIPRPGWVTFGLIVIYGFALGLILLTTGGTKTPPIMAQLTGLSIGSLCFQTFAMAVFLLSGMFIWNRPR